MIEELPNPSPVSSKIDNQVTTIDNKKKEEVEIKPVICEIEKEKIKDTEEEKPIVSSEEEKPVVEEDKPAAPEDEVLSKVQDDNDSPPAPQEDRPAP